MEDKGTTLKGQPWGHRPEAKAWLYFTEFPTPEEHLTVGFWYWLGEPSGPSQVVQC